MTDTTRTHWVAIVTGDRVLVDRHDALEHFEHDEHADDAPEPTAVASLLSDNGVHLAPVMDVPDSTDRLHVMAVRTRPEPDGKWLPIDKVTDPIGALIRLSVFQHRNEPPANRPDWYAPGWHDRVEAWIDTQLADSGQRRTGPLRTHRVWSISAVYRVPTEAGELWFKACCDHFLAEAAIVAVLARHSADLVPVLIGSNEAEGWLLMEPLVDADDAARAAGAAEALARKFAALQQQSLRWLDELRAAGAPDRGLEPTLQAWRAVLDNSSDIDLTGDPQLAATIDNAEALVREFWACGIPDTLSHGDLHLGNVAYDGSTLRVFDWTDGCITHPFLDGSHLAHFVDDSDPAAGSRLTAAFAEPWRATYPDADVGRALELAPIANLVFQTVTFDAIAAAAEPGVQEFGDVVGWLTDRLVKAVEAQV